jgi:hypothetical protein
MASSATAQMRSPKGEAFSKLLYQVALLASVALVSSCATVWVKPGATEAEFQGTKAACSGRSYSRYPPIWNQVQIMAAYYTPMQTQCTGSGYATNCFTTGGQYVPPATMLVDQNDGARSGDNKSCFYENGWTPKQ